jgi:hypothetical protein
MRSPNGPARRRTTHLRFRGSQHVESSRTSLRTPESCLLSLSSDRWCHDMRAEAEIDGDGDAAYQEKEEAPEQQLRAGGRASRAAARDCGYDAEQAHR